MMTRKYLFEQYFSDDGDGGDEPDGHTSTYHKELETQARVSNICKELGIELYDRDPVNYRSNELEGYILFYEEVSLLQLAKLAKRLPIADMSVRASATYRDVGEITFKLKHDLI